MLLSSVVLAGCGADLGQPDASVGRAGLLLPLTGRRAELGQILAQAASLGQGPEDEITLHDTGDTAEGAAAAAQAALAGGARLLLGPLFSAQTPAVLAVAGRVPVLTFSNDDALADRGAFVFGVTARQSATAALGYAAGQNLRRIAVVVPPGPFGAQALAAAQAIARDTGQALTPLVRAAPGGLASAVAEAEAVYLPSAGPELAGFAQALRPTGRQILGGAQWSAVQVTRIAGLEGAWFAAPDPLRFEPFARTYEAAFGGEAGILAGLGYDAAEMARFLGRLGSQDVGGLTREDGFGGALGDFKLGRDRRCRRALAILRVDADATRLIGAIGV